MTGDEGVYGAGVPRLRISVVACSKRVLSWVIREGVGREGYGCESFRRATRPVFVFHPAVENTSVYGSGSRNLVAVVVFAAAAACTRRLLECVGTEGGGWCVLPEKKIAG